MYRPAWNLPFHYINISSYIFDKELAYCRYKRPKDDRDRTANASLVKSPVYFIRNRTFWPKLHLARLNTIQVISLFFVRGLQRELLMILIFCPSSHLVQIMHGWMSYVQGSLKQVIGPSMRKDKSSIMCLLACSFIISEVYWDVDPDQSLLCLLNVAGTIQNHHSTHIYLNDKCANTL